ncbi:hypothetical protein EYF80_051649 [Liparis tanakae]|uniref:Uncharacterized protein n=1 Tax=Liparis tanakae TaxID=230148 RepID=A0A4Z2FBB3_9TELE|nr:hypothetical protein EYF80_051649 [Liparis tanakae]
MEMKMEVKMEMKMEVELFHVAAPRGGRGEGAHTADEEEFVVACASSSSMDRGLENPLEVLPAEFS